VRAEEGGEVGFVEAFVLEELKEVGGGRVDVGEEAFGGRGVGVFAPDVCLDAGTAGTGDDGVAAGEDWSVCVSELDGWRGDVRCIPIMSATLTLYVLARFCR
jgi:hypothetical protein